MSMGMMKRGGLVLFVLLVSGALTFAIARDKDAFKADSRIPVKNVQGILTDIDPLDHTITMDLGVVEDQEIKEHRLMLLKVDDEAFDQIHRVGKKGERLELRLSADDIVQSVSVGTGP
jgi:hypothetical protein